MHSYNINTKKILLYGAGSTAKVLIEKLEKENIEIYKFIDKRFDTIKEFLGIEVIGSEQIREISYKDEFVIIITTRNVFEHFKIANELYEQGFENIIFKPYSVLKGYANDELLQLSLVHDCYMANMKTFDGEIPKYKGNDMPAFLDKAIISKDKDMLKAFVPAELLYSNLVDGSEWEDMNFVSNYIAVKLYQALETSNYETFEDSINSYINRFAKKGAIFHGVNTAGKWANILIDSRIKSYSEMSKLFALDYNFFVKNSTTVKRSSDRKLRLIKSGKNRVSFLIAKGMQYIPVNISQEDYEDFLNHKQICVFKDYIKKNNIKEFFAPIPHPYFYEYGYVAENYCSVCLSKIGNFISEFVFYKYGSYYFEKIKILECIFDQGSLGRHLSLMGMNVYRAEFVNQELTQKIDDLLDFRAMNLPELCQSYDVGLITNQIEKTQFEEMLNRISDICVLFVWEDSDSYEELLYEKGFQIESKIFMTMWKETKVSGFFYKKVK